MTTNASAGPPPLARVSPGGPPGPGSGGGAGGDGAGSRGPPALRRRPRPQRGRRHRRHPPGACGAGSLERHAPCCASVRLACARAFSRLVPRGGGGRPSLRVVAFFLRRCRPRVPWLHPPGEGSGTGPGLRSRRIQIGDPPVLNFFGGGARRRLWTMRRRRTGWKSSWWTVGATTGPWSRWPPSPPSGRPTARRHKPRRWVGPQAMCPTSDMCHRHCIRCQALATRTTVRPAD